VGVERLWSILRLRVRSLFRSNEVEADLNDELRDHLERQIDAGIARGMTPEAARVAAYRSLGGVQSVKEACRDERRVAWIETLARDARYGLRILRRSPGFTTIGVLSLALGIGANTSIFQLLNALRLRPLAVERPGDLVIIDIADRGTPPSNYNGRYPDLTNPQWERLRQHAEPFDGMFVWGQASVDLAARGEQQFSEDALWVSGGFFRTLGVRAAAGRLFTEADDVPGCAAGVVISHAFWQRQYHGEAGVVGRRLLVNGRAFEILGVAERKFFGVEVGRSFDLALPLCAEAAISGSTRLTGRANWWLSAMARLKPGWSADRAAAYLRTISPGVFADTLPTNYSDADIQRYLAFSFRTRPGQSGFSSLRETYGTPLWLLLAVAGVVLLLACANLANLLLARSGARAREMAVRLALGASRGRLARQLLIESLLLAGMGALAGAWLAPLLGQAVVALISSDLSPTFVDLSPDWRLVLFATGLAAVTCVLFGLAPAMRATRIAPGEVVKTTGGRGFTGDRSQSRLRRGLVSIQVALSLVLLVAGLLFGRSLANLLTIETGFQQAGILQLDVDLNRLKLDPDGRRAVYAELLGRLRAMPTVDAAATSHRIPLAGTAYLMVFPEDGSETRKQYALTNRVGAGYFDTLNIPIVAGRDFKDTEDVPGAPDVVIANERFVREVLRAPSAAAAVGAEFRLEGERQQPGRRARLVGVVADTKYQTLREDFRPIIYRAMAQEAGARPSNQFLIRTRAPLEGVREAVTTTASAVSPEMSFHYHDFHSDIRSSLRQDRLMAVLCGFFALVGAILAAIGVYGVNAHAVTERRAEIGVRIALGADRRAIVSMVLREAGVLVGIGLAAGVGAALGASRVATGLLYGLQPTDPITVAGAVVLLGAVALAASYIPARRASRTSPVTALKIG
jgi:predicted permease